MIKRVIEKNSNKKDDLTVSALDNMCSAKQINIVRQARIVSLPFADILHLIHYC